MTLPPALEGFAGFLAAQPEPVRNVFYYCLCLMMVEGEKMDLVKIQSTESGPVCIFETSEGERFGVPRPDMTIEQEASVLQTLREILEDEDELE